MKKLLTIFLLFTLLPLSIIAQGVIDDQQRIFYRNERTYALLLNSNGFGFGYREGKRINFLNKRLIDIELNFIKHPKEIKLSNPYSQTAGSFVFGKLNNCITIKGGFGHQHELYKKIDLGGVAIRYFYSGGPVLAISKPIYYNVIYSVGGISYEIRQEKFDLDIHHPGDIYSKASFFKGINELGLIPGLYGKGGLNFEYSKEDKIIHAIELGVSLEAFPKKIPIMASDDNQAFFFTPFISYRVGIVIDPLAPPSSKSSTLFFKR